MVMNETEALNIYNKVYDYIVCPISVVGFVGNFMIMWVWHKASFHPTLFTLAVVALGHNFFMLLSHLCHYLTNQPCYQEHDLLQFFTLSTQVFVATAAVFMTGIHYIWMFHVYQIKFLTFKWIAVAFIIVYLWSMVVKSVAFLAEEHKDAMRVIFTLIGVALPALCQCILSLVMLCKYGTYCQIQSDFSKGSSTGRMQNRLDLSLWHERQCSQPQWQWQRQRTPSSLRSIQQPSQASINPHSTPSNDHRQSIRSLGSRRRMPPDLFQAPGRRHPAGSTDSIWNGYSRSVVRPTQVSCQSSVKVRLRLPLSEAITEMKISKAVVVVSFVPFFLYCISLIGYSVVCLLPHDHPHRPQRFLYRAALYTGLFINHSYQAFLFLVLIPSFRKPFRNFCHWHSSGSVGNAPAVGVSVHEPSCHSGQNEKADAQELRATAATLNAEASTDSLTPDSESSEDNSGTTTSTSTEDSSSTFCASAVPDLKRPVAVRHL